MIECIKITKVEWKDNFLELIARAELADGRTAVIRPRVSRKLVEDGCIAAYVRGKFDDLIERGDIEQFTVASDLLQTYK